MNRKSFIAALIALSLLGLSCNKSGGNSSAGNSTGGNSSVANTTPKSSGAAMSDDDKHKLYQAAMFSGDLKLVTQVEQKLGLFDANKKPTPAHDQFKKEHKEWVKQHPEWAKEFSDREKAKAYVNSHLS